MKFVIAVLVSLTLVTAGVTNIQEEPKPDITITRGTNGTVSSYAFNSTVIYQWFQQFFNNTTQSSEPPPVVMSEKCDPCECGIVNKQRRIVGGVETQVNQYPWMAMLLYRGRFYCGGTVINSRYVLTAAHCVDRFSREQISIRLLEHDTNSTTESETIDFKVQQIMKHAGYSTTNFNNDIALLRIDGQLKFDKKLKPVCLPERGKTFAGETGVVTGWGAVHEGGPISKNLQEVFIPIISNNECRMTKYPARKITDNMLCAGYKQGGKDSCQGDSGGPLHVQNGTIHRVVGVVSWGEGCAQPNYPGVYTRVNRFLSWIEKSTPDACYC